MAYVHLPVKTGAITAGDVEAFRRTLGESPQPVVAHCKTGTRSYLLWGAGEVMNGKRDAGDIVTERIMRRLPAHAVRRAAAALFAVLGVLAFFA